MNALIIVSSYHHKNTEKLAACMAKALGCRYAGTDAVNPQDFAAYDLVGFGSGIYDARHHQKLLTLADALPEANGKKAFIFSTDGVPRFLAKEGAMLEDKMRRDHTALREKLQAKGYTVIGEWGCAGFNTNAFLKYFGGVNKGRPNASDLARAEAFARGLTGTTERSECA